MARKNIKVPEDLFYALRENKDDQQSWPHYLEEQCLLDEADEIPPGLLKIQNATEDELQEIKKAIETVEERTGSIEKTLENEVRK